MVKVELETVVIYSRQNKHEFKIETLSILLYILYYRKGALCHSPLRLLA